MEIYWHVVPPVNMDRDPAWMFRARADSDAGRVAPSVPTGDICLSSAFQPLSNTMRSLDYRQIYIIDNECQEACMAERARTDGQP